MLGSLIENQLTSGTTRARIVKYMAADKPCNNCNRVNSSIYVIRVIPTNLLYNIVVPETTIHEHNNVEYTSTSKTWVYSIWNLVISSSSCMYMHFQFGGHHL